MKLKNIIISLFCLLGVVSNAIGQIRDKQIVLSENIVGNQEYIASQSITLQNNFVYKANGNESFVAKIDQNLVFPPTKDTYLLPDGTTTGDISAGVGGSIVGTIPGSIDVSGSGATVYSVPISCPAGLNGMQPQLAITYNSQADMGIVGYKASLSGLSSITRSAHNPYFDGDYHAISFDGNDRFDLDGGRLLVNNDKTYNSADANYSKEIEDYSNIIPKGTYGDGPEWFEVTLKDGTVLQYGNTADSKMILSDKKGIYKWNLNQVTDVNGNYMKYIYESKSDGQTWLAEIQYTGNSNGSIVPIYSVKFLYKEITCPIYYISENLIHQTQRLTNIQIIYQDNLLTQYNITYYSDATFGTLYKDRIKSITLQNSIGEKLKPTSFIWADMYTSENLPTLPTGTVVGSCDLNGNGISEIILLNGDYLTIYEKNNNAFIVLQNVNLSTLIKNKTGYYFQKLIRSCIGVDINNDGKEELVLKAFNFYYPMTKNICLVLNNDLSILKYFDVPINSINPIIGNFDGDEYSDVLINNASCVIYNSSKTLTVTFSDGLSLTNSDIKNIFSGDFNGDGISDLAVHKTNEIVVYSLEGSVFTKKSSLVIATDEISIADINNDGITDVFDAKNIKIYYFSNYKQVGCNPWTIIGINYSFSTYSSDIQIRDLLTHKIDKSVVQSTFLGDINTDGLMDVVRSGSVNYVYKGNVWNFIDIDGYSEYDRLNKFCNEINSSNPELAANYTKIELPNGTATIELTIKSLPLIQNCIQTSDGTFMQGSISFLPATQLGSNHELVSGDFAGDGRVDFFLKYELNNANKFAAIPNRTSTPTHLSNINTGIGEGYTISNSSLKVGNYYTKDATREAGIANYAGSMMATRSISMPDGQRVDYSYTGAKIHLLGKGFLGFKSITSQLFVNKTTTSDYKTTQSNNVFNSDYIMYVPFDNVTTILSNVETRSQTLNPIKINYSNSSDKRIKLQLTLEKLSNPSEAKYIDTNYSNFDEFGNPKTIITNNRVTTSTQTIAYPSAGWWRKTKPLAINTTTTKSGDTPFTQKVVYTYNANGNLLTETVNDDLVTSYLEYNNVRNPELITVSAITKDLTTQAVIQTSTKSTRIEYSTDLRFVKSKTNVETQQKVEYEYFTDWGVVKKEKTALGETNYYINGFGQVFETHFPSGLHQATSMQWANGNGPTGASYFAHTKATGVADNIVWFDNLGRTIRQDSERNAQKVYVSTTYNSKGQVYQVSEPYFSGTPQYNTYAYNSDGRLSSFTNFAGEVTTYAYSTVNECVKTTITSPQGSTSAEINAIGQVVKSTDACGAAVVNSYWASGLIKTNKLSNNFEVRSEYDKFGHRTKLIDPSAGTITSQYNPLGEILWETDNKNNKTVYSYDTKNRLDNITRGNEVTTNGYDNLGRLISVDKKVDGLMVHQQTFEFSGNTPLLNSKTEKIDNKTFSVSYEYDNLLKRLTKKTYHTGLAITYGYNSGGEVVNVSANTKNSNGGTTTYNVWQLNDINARGQVIDFSQGGTLNTSIGYNTKGLITSQYTVNSNNAIVDYEYTYDAANNLHSRRDNNAGFSEVFTYNNSNQQLTNWDISNLSSNYTTIIGGGAMKYLPTGNVVSKKDNVYLNTTNEPTIYNYGENNASPNAITSFIGDPVDMKPQTIDYTVFNKVKSMAVNNADNTPYKQFNITYGVDDQRRATHFTEGANNTPTLTRYYFDGYEEEVFADNTVRKIHYISGGNGLAALFITDEAQPIQNGMYYAHTDNLGSLIALSKKTDSGFDRVKRYAYDPWGNRRNPENWAQALGQDNTYSYTSRGYTLHEHLDDYGIINMNGRVYDPMLSRFLSPDPFIQSPNSPLSYNRYAYCMNNPFMYTDPSGNTVIGNFFRWVAKTTRAGWDGFWEALNGKPDPQTGQWKGGLAQPLRDINCPSFGAGYSSGNGFGYYVGNNPMIYPSEVKATSDQAIVARTTITFSTPINQKGANFVNNMGVSSKNVMSTVNDVSNGIAIGGFVTGLVDGTFRVAKSGEFSLGYYASGWSKGNQYVKSLYSVSKLGANINTGASIITTGYSYNKIINEGNRDLITYTDAAVGSIGLTTTAATYFSGIEIPVVGFFVACYGSARAGWDFGASLAPKYGPINGYYWSWNK